MADGISNVGNRHVPSTINETIELAESLGISGKSMETIKEVAALLGGRNVSFNSNERVNNTETGKPTGPTSIPALDNPEDIKQIEQNLEKLISYLQMDNDARQAQMAKDRIEIQKESIDKERQNRSEKIEKSIKEMEDAARSRKASKFFGWFMTAIAVVAAVVACVATGGLAIGPVIGAGIAIACQVLNETGVMDKLVSKLAEGLQELGLSKQAAQILAQVIITAAIMAASLGAGFAGGGANAVSSVIKGTAETIDKVRTAVAIAATVVGIASTVTGGVSAYDGYSAGMSEADVKETEKILAQLKQQLEESEEELEAILQRLQAGIAQIAEMLASATDTSNEITQNIGSMA